MNQSATNRKAWAVLAYTVADDRGGASALDTAAQEELRALCDAADYTQVSVAAQVDFKRPKGVFRGSLTARPPVMRDFTAVQADTHPLWRKILGAVDEQRSVLNVEVEHRDLNAARADVLHGFLTFGRKACPAERYVTFFYGHAYGPMGLFCDRETGQRETETLRLNDLAGTLRAGGRAAIVVFRDCFMNTLEAAYQLRGAAEFMIATQALAPIAGVWPWEEFMATLAPDPPSIEVAREVASRLAAFLDEPAHRAPFAEVPYSLLDLDHATAVAAPLKSLVDALEAARRDPAREVACAPALGGAGVGSPTTPTDPGDPALVDVPTMCERLGALKGDPVAAAARTLGNVISGRLVAWHHSRRGRFKGTSLFYKPVTARDLRRSYLQAEDETIAAADAEYYKSLALCRATGWHRVALNPLAVKVKSEK
jgi:hypothetical protein